MYTNFSINDLTCIKLCQNIYFGNLINYGDTINNGWLGYSCVHELFTHFSTPKIACNPFILLFIYTDIDNSTYVPNLIYCILYFIGHIKMATMWSLDVERC